MMYFCVKDTRDDIFRETIEFLIKVYDYYKINLVGIVGGCMFVMFICEFVNEYLYVGDYESVFKLFKIVVVVYRREKWNELLCFVFMNFKMCVKVF